MKIQLLFIALSVGLLSHSQDLSIYFETKSVKIPDSSINAIRALAKQHANCFHGAEVSGYSDAVGSVEANLTLSNNRAEAVALLLKKAGIKERILVKAFGEHEAVSVKDSSANTRFRRVDIVVPQLMCGGVETTIEELYRQLQDVGQEFCINPDRDTALTGVNGTIVYYRQGTFKNTAGCQCLKLVLHEFYKKSDLILNNLTTTSDGRPLESGGMTKLEGFCGQDSLQYNDGRFLTVMMPTDTLLPGMKLLSANRNNVADVLNWQLDKEYPDIDGFNWDRMRLWCSFSMTPPAKCPFFFCKIGVFFNRFFGGKNNVPFTGRDKEYEKERALLQKYAVQEQKMGEALLVSKKNNPDALNYYVYKNANWNYHNIDRFANGEPMENYVIKEVPDKSKDVKLVVKITKTILPGIAKADHYVIERLFSKMPVWIVGLRYYRGQSYLALQEGNSSVNPQPLQFNAITIDQLKQLLKKLD